jgi:chromosome segregation ATPase
MQLQKHFLLSLRRDISNYPVSFRSLAEGKPSSIMDVVKLLCLAQVECEKSEEYLPRILELAEGPKTFIAQVIEEMREDARIPYIDASVPGNQEDYERLENELIERNRELVIREQREQDLVSKLEDANQVVVRTQEELDKLKVQEQTTRTIDVYKETIAMLESKIKKLESVPNHSDELTRTMGEMHVIEQERDSLRGDLEELRMENRRIREEVNEKEKEMGQFVMTGGALGGQIRDRIIRTLQEQLAVRDEEIEILRQQRLDSLEEQRKGERLLVSAVHAVSLRYHEQMVRAMQHGEPNLSVPEANASEEFYSQEYHNSS